MSASTLCRLCFSSADDQHLNLFSDIGIELQMAEIIADHFKCNVSEDDSLPNFVCHECWSITETFHKLYQKTQLAQAKFLNVIIKTEIDTMEVVPENTELIICDENSIEIGEVKLEQVDGESQKCSHCPKAFVDLNALDVHMQVYHSEFRFKCRYCYKGFKKNALLKQHEETHTRHNIYPCNMCDKVYFAKSSLAGHVRKIHIGFEVKCKYCGKVYKAHSSLASHVKRNHPNGVKIEYNSETGKPRKEVIIDQNKIKFKKLFAENKQRFDMTCDKCPTVFESLEEALKHYPNQHDIKRGYIKCCRAKLNSIGSVLTHLDIHLNPIKMKCPECDKVYSSMSSFKHHMETHLGCTYICDICKKIFKSKIAMKRHLKSHALDESNTLKDELYNEFIATNFDMSCDHCDAVLISLYESKNHYKECHNNEMGYIKCCNIKFREASIIRDHINFHWNPDSFKCHLCNKRYTSRIRYNAHKRRHCRHNNKFMCDICGKCLRDRDAIKRHRKRAHPDKSKRSKSSKDSSN